MKKSYSVRALARLSLLCALAVSLSALEGPISIALPPGARVGLSNVIVMTAAAYIGLPSALIVALFKAVFALLVRGALSFLMSLAGGLSSALVLWLLFRCASRFLGTLGISMAGALTHSLAQLFVSCFVYGRAILGYAPILVLFALPSGILTAVLLRAARSLTLHTLHHKRKDQTHP